MEKSQSRERILQIFLGVCLVLLVAVALRAWHYRSDRGILFDTYREQSSEIYRRDSILEDRYISLRTATAKLTTPATPVVPPSDFKQFTSADGEYELSYPSSWVVNDSNPDSIVFTVNPGFNRPTTTAAIIAKKPLPNSVKKEDALPDQLDAYADSIRADAETSFDVLGSQLALSTILDPTQLSGIRYVTIHSGSLYALTIDSVANFISVDDMKLEVSRFKFLK